MKQSTKFVLITLAVSGIVAGAAVHANNRGHDSERMVAYISDRLELDSSQADALRLLQNELDETHAIVRGNTELAQGTIETLIDTTPFDQEEALRLINERITALQSNAPEVVAAAGAFLDGLSDQQRETLKQLAERAERHGGHRRPRHGFGD